jgi:hypothetical protein
MLRRGELPITKLVGKIQIDRLALDKLMVERTAW